MRTAPAGGKKGVGAGIGADVEEQIAWAQRVGDECHVGELMQADMDETVHIRLEGTMAELFTRLDPDMYRKYTVFENGKLVLYVELLKALYGTLRAALLFWRKLTKKLLDWGFEINPYDWCVANKMINGKQCTILWHVDDLKISHVQGRVVDDVLRMLDEEFGKEAPITIRAIPVSCRP